ncbi:uncharacterized protein [Halyomorpha halys]|uniref:uncharacterized protein n=1 Tax=Halyomorpha halys TaxID=286706 RepID=UPI0006D4E907|nr:uncharacterized protein LOC106681871 [Halyomorpha halys]
MEPHLAPFHFNTTSIADESRALMTNAGNFSMTFVPLISIVATLVPTIVSRIRTLRPTPTVSSRGYRSAKYYAKDSIDYQFCSNKDIFEAKLLPGFDDIFYACKPHYETKSKCKSKEEYYTKDDLQILEKLSIGKIVGKNDCFYLQIYKCDEGSRYDPEKTKCIKKQ